MLQNILIFFLFITSLPSLAQDILSISANGVRVRSAPTVTAKVLGMLNINDQVRKIQHSSDFIEDFVEIEIVQTRSPILSSEKYFISNQYLADHPTDYKEFKGKYFVVMNVASEMLRVYERICADDFCYNKMLLETETVVGEDKNNPKDAPGKGRSILGSYRLTGWKKFYEDSIGHYPAWYNDSYPPIPSANAQNPAPWFLDKYMPLTADGKINGKIRGAFGWYTAFVAPQPFGQWIHGTIGWGENKDYYIQATKKFLTNILFDPRSSGCIRNNNEAIAYLRQILEIGSPIIKIYAKEQIFDPTLPIYKEEKKEWDYVLTKHAIQQTQKDEVVKALGTTTVELDAYWAAKKSGSGVILDPSDPLNEVLEVGQYTMDIHPDAVEFIPGERMSRLGRKILRSGNVYGIKSKDMSGIFFVDTGMLVNYNHPRAVLEVSGFSDEITPSWMQKL